MGQVLIIYEVGDRVRVSAESSDGLSIRASGAPDEAPALIEWVSAQAFL